MLAQILKQRPKVFAALVVVNASLFVACANHDQHVALVNDPDDKHDSMIPWNKQEKWETENQMGGITDRR